MYVPNYVPPPVEVPYNVTQEKYAVRIAFIRRVSVLHLGSIFVIGGLSILPLPPASLGVICGELGCLLLALSLIRIGTRATRLDLICSSALLPALILVLSMLTRNLNHSGWPMWGLAVGVSCASLYAMLCGRDFSFVGQYLLSLIASTVALAVCSVSMDMSARQAAFLLAGNAVFLFYAVYDLASLLARRRVGEEAAAVVDLYRDVFNVFGYLVRVARHWKKHRIWVPGASRR